MRFAIAGLIFVFVAAICFSFFVMFNYILYNPDDGVQTILNESVDNIFSPTYQDAWNTTTSNIEFGFGLSGVVCMGIAFACFIADAISKPPIGE